MRYLNCFACITSLIPGLALAQENQSVSGDLVLLEPYMVSEPQVANEKSATSFTQPITELRFEPKIDVQTRNMAEGQGDVSIRGGIFENTGFSIGALTVYDPQTGHYSAELPIPPAMLTSANVETGVDNAVFGFNSTVGSINYNWMPITNSGYVSAGFGAHDYYYGSLLAGQTTQVGQSTLGAQVSVSHSESDGAIIDGDHDIERYAARLQLISVYGQTDFFAGYQDKFFGWPNMYTPFGVSETEDLQTSLFMLNHRLNLSETDYLQVSSYYRKNNDHYIFNRYSPDNAYVHQTQVYALGADGHLSNDSYGVTFSAQVLADDLESTSLVYGNFDSRAYANVSVLPEYYLNDEWTIAAGASLATTDHDSTKGSPIAKITYKSKDLPLTLYTEYAQISQVAGYTAIAGSSTGGLFRGNQNLGREVSDNLELGALYHFDKWTFKGAVFYRQDDDLVDWTYNSSYYARFANPVDIDTVGFEASAKRKWKNIELNIGYTYLSKSEDYGDATVDASFYALNYAKHRLTLAINWEIIDGLMLSCDNELRAQQDNNLRNSDSDAFITSIGLTWKVPYLENLELEAVLDNAWDDDFEEVPGTPACPRQYAVGMTYSW